MAEAEERSLLCRACGKPAFDACSNCHSRYCSKACQKWEWKHGGHKALCQGPASNRKIHTILRELFAAEWQWLQGLSPPEKETLFRSEFQDVPLNHLFMAGEVALVLARANPCALLSSFPRHKADYGFEYYSKVITPWYKAHKEFLNQQGFFVEFIPHGVFVSDRPCQCLGNGKEEACGELANMAWRVGLIKDIRSPMIGLVNTVFTNVRFPTLEEWTEAETSITWKQMMQSLFIAQTREGTQEEGSNVCYNFQQPKQVFGDEDVGYSPCFSSSFLVDPEDGALSGDHFHRCYKAMSSIGFPITLAICHKEDWPVSAIAETWWAASGKNTDTFEKWIKNDIGLVTGEMTRRTMVISTVREMALSQAT